MVLPVAGSDVLVSRTQNCMEPFSVNWITSTGKLSDGNMDTCERFNGFHDHTDPFANLWVYTDKIIGSLHVHVIGNYICWPEVELRVVRMTSGGQLMNCSPREKPIVRGNNHNICTYHCRCKSCGDYIIVQLPIKQDKVMGGSKVCEIALKSLKWCDKWNPCVLDNDGSWRFGMSKLYPLFRESPYYVYGIRNNTAHWFIKVLFERLIMQCM